MPFAHFGEYLISCLYFELFLFLFWAPLFGQLYSVLFCFVSSTQDDIIYYMKTVSSTFVYPRDFVVHCKIKWKDDAVIVLMKETEVLKKGVRRDMPRANLKESLKE